MSAGKTRRSAMFGGTFDPIHIGHLHLAEWAREQLSLDRVLFVPAATPPHKRGQGVTEAKHRLEMVEIALAGNSAFEIATLEIDRAGVSFTVDTLRELVNHCSDDEWFLLMGSDSLAEFATWREPVEILRLAQLIIIPRMGSEVPPRLQWPTPLAAAAERVRVIDAPLLDISSRLLRRRVSEGKSIRYLVPSGVAAFVGAHRLYCAD
jgi:nicotinate-nucleotide adenylyltransferase